MAGLIKVVLAFQHECVPPHLHFKEPTPRFPWETSPLQVVNERRPWPRNGKRRIAGLSSFGFSGTNAHIVLEEAPTAEAAADRASDSEQPHLLTLTARSPEALKALSSRYATYLTANPDVVPTDLCFTAATGRSHFQHRVCVVAASPSEFAERLAAFAQEEPAPPWCREASGGEPRPPARFSSPVRVLNIPAWAVNSIGRDPCSAAPSIGVPTSSGPCATSRSQSSYSPTGPPASMTCCIPSRPSSASSTRWLSCGNPWE